VTAPSAHDPAPPRPRRRFIAWSLLTGALLVAIIAALRLLGHAPQTVSVADPHPPRLQVDRELIDLGDRPMGQWAEANFVLANVGEGTLRLTAAPYVRAVAGC